jgi:hypothetical protein
LGLLLSLTTQFNANANSLGSATIFLPFIHGDGTQTCPDSLHNPNEWHPLVDPVNGCHYDHEHKHDPNEVADIFGPAGAWFGGTSISYPWQTPDENETKHEAYSWIVRRNIPSNGRDAWIRAFRWQVHATSAPFTGHDGTLHGGYLSRFHSHSLEAQVCNSNGQCGIVRTGGWIDYGNLEIDNIDDCVYLSGDPSQQEACNNLGRRRIHFYNSTSNIPEHSSFFWYGRAGLINGPIPALHPFQVAVATGDNSVNVVPGDLYSLNFFCPNWDCVLNNSTIQAHVVGFGMSSSFDPDGNGLANFNGYTDRYGVVVNNCTAPGPTCIPLIVQGSPVSLVQHRDDQDLGLNTSGAQDFDTSPPGEWWIEYPDPPSGPAWWLENLNYFCAIPDTEQLVSQPESTSWLEGTK